MKTLESILQGVDPDTLIADDCMSLEESRFVTRAARNFAPLVRALQEISTAPSLTSRSNVNEIARKALAQALADEP